MLLLLHDEKQFQTSPRFTRSHGMKASLRPALRSASALSIISVIFGSVRMSKVASLSSRSFRNSKTPQRTVTVQATTLAPKRWHDGVIFS